MSALLAASTMTPGTGEPNESRTVPAIAACACAMVGTLTMHAQIANTFNIAAKSQSRHCSARVVRILASTTKEVGAAAQQCAAAVVVVVVVVVSSGFPVPRSA